MESLEGIFKGSTITQLGEEGLSKEWAAEEWGVDLNINNSPNSVTVKYTDFILGTSKGPATTERTDSAAYGIAAITPFLTMYSSHIGEEIAPTFKGWRYDLYEKWHEYHISEELKALADDIQELFENLADYLTREEKVWVSESYLKATELLAEFFASYPPTVAVVLLCIAHPHDPLEEITIFCGLESVCDVVSVVLSAAKGNVDGIKSSVNPSGRSFFDHYELENKEQIQGFLPEGKGDMEFDHGGLRKWLRQLEKFEKRVVQGSGEFGTYYSEVKSFAEVSDLYKGSKEFFRKTVEKRAVQLQIVSYLSCPIITRAFLSSVGCHLDIYPKETEMSASSGGDELNMVTFAEKFLIVNARLYSRFNMWSHMSVYIGIAGSVSDLLCMLEADVGIVLGSSLLLQKFVERFGVVYIPLDNAVASLQKKLKDGGCSPQAWKQAKRGIVYTVRDWSEIDAFILGL